MFRSAYILRKSLAASKESALERKAASDYGTRQPVLSEYGTYKKVKVRFRLWLEPLYEQNSLEPLKLQLELFQCNCDGSKDSKEFFS